MSYIGSTPTTQSFIAGTDSFNGTGLATNFTLSRFVNSVNDVQVVVNNVVQYPPNYSVSGTTLTISPAPSAGTNNVYVRYLSTTLQSIAPSQGSSIQFGTGSAALPSISFIGDANTGIYSPAADTIAFAEGGVEAVRFDSSGNVGIGTSSPSSYTSGDQLVIASASGNGQMTLAGADNGNPTLNFRRVSSPSTTRGYIQYDNTAEWMRFATNGSERARINSSGNLLVGTTAVVINGNETVSFGKVGAVGLIGANSTTVYSMYIQNVAGSGASSPMIRFSTSNGVSGTIISTSTSTTYATSSDYRLKEDVQPMTGALEKIAALKPCTYKWKADGRDGEGFIAHELQAVCPDAVTGQKDEIDEDGSIKPQGIDTSFLVATLTAAIQEQQAMIDTMKQEIAELKAKVGE
jgi:hypothetical protein